MDKVGSAKGSAAVCQPVKLPFVIKISQGQGDGIAGESVGPKIRCIDSLVTPAREGGAYGPQHQGQKNPLSKAAFRTLADHGTLQNDQCPHDAVTAAPLGEGSYPLAVLGACLPTRGPVITNVSPHRLGSCVLWGIK